MGENNWKPIMKNNWDHYILLSRLQTFEALYPVNWLRGVVMQETNKRLILGELKYGELLQFLGISMQISTTTRFCLARFLGC